MKKPKLSKFPKQPKANANSAVWERYFMRCKTVSQRNEQKLKPYIAERAKKKAIVKSVVSLKTTQSTKLSNQLNKAAS